MTKTVLLMRRGELSEDELAALESAFPEGTQFEFVADSPDSGDEWLESCTGSDADLVVLPQEQPLPTKAMEAGFSHIVFLPGKGWKKLIKVVPVFESF
jgi:hypothetical protein